MFRSRLLETEREVSELKLSNAQLRTMQRAKEQELGEVQKRNTGLDQANEHLRSQIVQYELERQELEREVIDRN